MIDFLYAYEELIVKECHLLITIRREVINFGLSFCFCQIHRGRLMFVLIVNHKFEVHVNQRYCGNS